VNPTVTYHVGDARKVLATLPEGSVDCVLSSARATNGCTIGAQLKRPRRCGNTPGPGRDPWEVPTVTKRTWSDEPGRNPRARLQDPVANWWKKVDVRGPDECWPWKRSCTPNGYGKHQVGLGGHEQRHVSAHRFGYEVLVGPIPEGMYVCHRCDNPPCCNPSHWFLGTPKDNNDDKVAKGRHARVWGRPLNRSRQTHCHCGHELSGDNLKLNPKTGHRSCRTCERANQKRYYEKKGPKPRPIIECVDCGGSRPHRAHGRCSNCDARWRCAGGARRAS
jgi:hypothetical protein